MRHFLARLFHRYGWVSAQTLERENLKVLLSLTQNHRIFMATIDQLTQDIADEATLEDSVLALLTSIKQQLTDALAGITLNPATQAKVDAAFAALEANKAKLATALMANTPAADTPTDQPGSAPSPGASTST